MNNIKKFEKTLEALIRFKKQVGYLEEVESKYESDGVHSRLYKEALEKDLQAKQLSISKYRTHIIFQSAIFGEYMQPIRKTKRTMNVIPLCFLFQLYKEDLNTNGELENNPIDIPFTLRGFWQMDKANEFLKRLISFQIDSAMMIEEVKYINKDDIKKLNKLTKILRGLEALEISVSKHKYEIKFKEYVFRINMKNRKLDVVPLCKMITSYYVTIMNRIENCENILEDSKSKEKVDEIKENFRKLIESYFIMYLTSF